MLIHKRNEQTHRHFVNLLSFNMENSCSRESFALSKKNEIKILLNIHLDTSAECPAQRLVAHND